LFSFLSGIIVLALLTFGAVQPHSWLFLCLLWIIGVLTIIGYRLIRNYPLDFRFIGLLTVVSIFGVATGLKTVLGFVAAVWAWEASKSKGRILRFFRILVIVGVAEAVLGLFQYFVAPGWILGYQNEPTMPVSGTLINRNHFAGLLGMIIPISLSLAYARFRNMADASRSYLFGLAGVVMALALIFSLSRMGLITFLTTLTLIVMLLRLRRSEGRFGALLAFGIPAFVIAGALWIGVDAVVQRYGDNPSEYLLELPRASTYRDTLRMIGDNPFGVGSNRYADVFRQYQTAYNSVLFDHAHNDYLETIAEWGIVVGLTMWLGLWGIELLCVWRFLHTESEEDLAILLGCAGSIFAMLMHSLVDFNLQIPSNAILFFSIVGVAVRLVTKKRSINRQVAYRY